MSVYGLPLICKQAVSGRHGTTAYVYPAARGVDTSKKNAHGFRRERKVMYVSRYACRPISISAAISKQPVEKDQAVTVHDLEGLVFEVEPVSESETTNAELQT